jgi:choline dehydrogenase-like flavoprotein
VPDYDAYADGAQPAVTPAEAGSVSVWSVLAPSAEALASGGLGNYRVMLGTNENQISLNVCWEQAPHRDSRLTLADTRDRLGNRQVRVEWKLSETDIRTYKSAIDAIPARLDQDPLRLNVRYNWVVDIENRNAWRGNLVPGDHPMGGTRMSASAADGVVDANCRVHDVKNLYVSSSSNWPSGGWANPTLTIVAMALRLADHLRVLEGGGAAVLSGEVPSPAAVPA